MHFVQFQLASYPQNERECNCLRGQVNGHKATLYFTLSTTYLGTCPRSHRASDQAGR